MKHNLKNPLVLEEGAEYYADSTSPDKYRPMPGQYVSKEVADEMLLALKKIRDFDDDSEYDDPGQIAIEAIKNATE